MAAVKIKDLKKAIETQAGWLGTKEQTIHVANFFSPESDVSKEVLASAETQSGFISELVEPITILISPYAKFSFLDEFAVQYPSWSEEMLTDAASALYEASLQTNLQIIERQISQVRPKGIQVGFEAKAKRDDINFILENPNDYPLELTFHSKENGQLNVEISGYPLGKRYEVRLAEIKSYPFRIIVQYDPLAPVGSETVKQVGINGTSVTVYRDIFSVNGDKVKTEKISDDFYLPVHQIVVRPIVSSTDTTGNATNVDTITPNDAVEEKQTEDIQQTEETQMKDQTDETKPTTETKE